jgi:hypothetical protein
MYPNDPSSQPPTPTDIDYLNQIAPPVEPVGFGKKSKILMIVAAIICAISLVFIGLAALSSSGSGSSPVALSARLQMLQKVSKKYGPKLRTAALQDINSSFHATLLTANNSLGPIVAASGIDAKQIATQTAQLSSSVEIEKKLDDAHLNSTLDDVYTREITYQIQDTIVMMERLNRSTRSAATREFLDKTIADFKILYEQFGGTAKFESDS